ncbi:MAG: universal stress protein [Candidatus Acidiferrales bacterium]
MDIRKILFPIEFHETSLRIIGVAASIARRFHSELVLLHVIAPGSYSPRDWKDGQLLESRDLLTEFVGFAEKDLHESVRPELEGLPVRCLVRQGDAAEEIAAVSREESMDLIVMPTRGYTGFYRYLIGSVTAKVIHDTERPVLTAAHLERTPNYEFGVKHVLCGVTFSGHSHEVLKCAAKVAAEFQARLTIAHVTPDVEMYGPGGNYVDRPWKDELVLSAQELIAKIQQQMGVQAETAVDSGDPGIALSRIANRIGADLLVVGCHTSGGHLGSNGYGIISESRIPVLSV